MADVGINITATENLSSLAPKMIDSLRSMGQAGKEMQENLDLSKLDPAYAKYADEFDKLQTMRQAQAQGQQGVGGAQIKKLEGQIPQILRTGGGALEAAGKGDAVAGGAGLLGGLGSIVSGMGPAGMIAGGLAAGLFAINAVAKIYEEMVPTLLDVNSSLGELDGTYAENTNTIRENMNIMTESAAEFGYSLNEANDAVKVMATKGGLARAGAFAGAENVYAFARAYGVAPGQLSEQEALSRRFGQGSALGYAAGGIQQGDLNQGMFKEFLSGTMTIFEEGLSRGIIKGFDDISTTQNWIGQLGAAFQGQYGINLYRSMESAVVGATGLSAEKDIIIFRAAQRALGEEGSRSLPDVMEYLEKGINQDLFVEIRKIVESMTGGAGGTEEDKIRQYMELFPGISWKTGRALIGMTPTEAIEAIGAPEGAAKSRELTMLQLQTEIAGNVAKMSTVASDLKQTMIPGIAKTLNTISNAVDRLAGRRTEREDKEEFKASKVGLQAQENIKTAALEGKFGSSVIGKQLFAAMTGASGGGFGVGAQRAEQELANIIANMTNEELKLFGESGGMKAIRRAAKANISKEEELTYGFSGVAPSKITSGDMATVLRAFIDVMEKLDITIDRERVVEITVEERTPTIPMGY